MLMPSCARNRRRSDRVVGNIGPSFIEAVGCVVRGRSPNNSGGWLQSYKQLSWFALTNSDQPVANAVKPTALVAAVMVPLH